jgi:hypothetical protein
MTAPQNIADALPGNDDRRYKRVKVDLLGRYMLSDGREYPCQIPEISPGGMAVIAPVVGKENERVVAYVDHLGRLEGTVIRVMPNGFAMSISATSRKREKLAAQLTWLANRELVTNSDGRRRDGVAPRNPHTMMTMANGITVGCEIVDMSLSGAAIACETKPPVGELIVLGKTQARVVRHTQDGFAVEFTRLQHPDFIEDNVTGS